MADRDGVILVCGHESGRGAHLRPLAGPGTAVVTAGRELHRALAAGPADRDTVVVPMTLGREPSLAAESARTVRALPPELRRGVAVADPLGTVDHLVGWLRAAASRLDPDSALLLAAPGGDPHEDAELARAAYLVRRNGRHRLVETALIGGDPDIAEGLRRCVLLGARRIAVLPAWFGAVPLPPAVDDVPVRDAGPLLGSAALAGVVAARAAAARHRLREHGDDGVGRALGAADGFGLGHTHEPGEHDHTHAHGQGHDQGHRHAHGHVHDHGTPSPTARPVTGAGARSHP
ncbi:cobalamin biosynthesis protein CbiX [Uniformispora flossi]|uniref:sirohydrochlorin chelatase n=1 Tax=Uniformispora flossi TaxID=3390723 RepID=UPI003C2D3E30